MGISSWLVANLGRERRGVVFSDGLMSSLRSAGDAVGPVTPNNSMQITSVFACVRVLSESLASLPLILYERQKRGKRQAIDHPLFSLLRDLPNPEITSVELRMWMMGHLALWGNAYGQIVRSRSGQVLELWPLRPDRMQVYRQQDGWLWYYYSPDLTTEPDVRKLDNWYRFDEILHLRGLGFDGVMGYNPIRLMAKSLLLAKGSEAFGTKFYENGARPGVVLKHPSKLSQPAYERLRSNWEARHAGIDNAHRVAILEEGMGIEEIGVPPQDAQFMETRKFQRGEIASMFRVPPHMIGDLDRATFSNIEQQGLEFVQYTLGPWLRIWEQAIARDLLTVAERKKYMAEHLADWLLRGDTLARYQAYQSALTAGWMTPNEAREKENMNPAEGGDSLLQPLNMTPAGQKPADPNARSVAHTELPDCTCALCQPTSRAFLAGEQRDTDDHDHVETVRAGKVKLMRALLPAFEDAATRVVKRETQDLRRAVDKQLRKRSAQDFVVWLREFYNEFPVVVRDNFDGLMDSYGEQLMTLSANELGKVDPGFTDSMRRLMQDYLVSMANGYAGASRRQIEALLADAQTEGADPVAYIIERLDAWLETKPKRMAQQQTVEAGNALAIAAYETLEVQRLRWAASGTSCRFCQSLNGKIVGIKEFFIQAGSHLDGGADGTMLVRNNTRHGPIHSKCDCVVVAD